jgi:hypothetical protein
MRGVTQLLIDNSHNAGKVAATSGHDTFAEIDTTDLANLVGKLPAFALPGAAWFCSQFAYAMVFARLAMTSGGITVLPINGRPMPHFMGFPIFVTQVLPAGINHFVECSYACLRRHEFGLHPRRSPHHRSAHIRAEIYRE